VRVMYTVQPSPSRRALSLFATFRVWAFSVRPYFVFTAPESVPPWPASRTTFPEQVGCVDAPVAKAAVVRRIAASIATSTVAHALKRPINVIEAPSFPSGSISRRRGGTRSRGFLQPLARLRGGAPL